MKPDPFEIVGTTLDGRYRIDEVVGEGGFGVVYRAFHPGFDAAIAIKVLKVPHGLKSSERDELLATFHQEGKLLFALSKLSASFVQVLEKGVLWREGKPVAPYLVLEWLNGRTLGAEIKERRARGQGRLSLDETLAILGPIAEALSIAHTESKVAHRDVKPDNMFLVRGTRGGANAKLLDFGIAKVMTSTGSAALNDPTLRAAGALTPQYAAPEQWNLKYGHTGPWTDVYALALVCIELLSGRPVLEGDEPSQLFGATIDPERPTPIRRGVAVPPRVEHVFLQALAVKPEERYRDMRSFWDALTAAAADRASMPGLAAPTPVPPGLDPITTPLALAPTQPAPPPAYGHAAPSAYKSPAYGQPSPLPGHGQAATPLQTPAAAVTSPTAIAGTSGPSKPQVPARNLMIAAAVTGALALTGVGAGFLALRGPSPAQTDGPPATPSVPAPPAETPGAAPPIVEPAPTGAGTAPPAAGSGAPKASAAPAASDAQLDPTSDPGASSAPACRQRSDCKDGKKCVRGACRYVECTENRDCSGPRACNLQTNACEWAVPHPF